MSQSTVPWFSPTEFQFSGFWIWRRNRKSVPKATGTLPASKLEDHKRTQMGYRQSGCRATNSSPCTRAILLEFHQFPRHAQQEIFPGYAERRSQALASKQKGDRPNRVGEPRQRRPIGLHPPATAIESVVCAMQLDFRFLSRLLQSFQPLRKSDSPVATNINCRPT